MANTNAGSSEPTGPKFLNQLGKDADESRTLVDLLCKRLLRPDFESGKVPGRVSCVDELLDVYVPPTLVTAVLEADRDSIRRGCLDEFMKKLIKPGEWEEACQRVHAWQDELETCSGGYDRSTLSRILLKNSKFPTVEKVAVLLGEEVAEDYKRSLETIEADPEPFAEFPDEKTSGGWNRHNAERAVSLVVDVIAPHGRDPEQMSAAYGRYMEELRSQNREKKITHNANKEQRKAAARSLGIWLPLQNDIPQWESDPRTCDRAAEFEKLVMRVMAKMRILRTVLQYIPRRRFSNHTVADLDHNMTRMRAYIKDDANKVKSSTTTSSSDDEDSNDDGGSSSEENSSDEEEHQKKKKKKKRNASGSFMVHISSDTEGVTRAEAESGSSSSTSSSSVELEAKQPPAKRRLRTPFSRSK